MSLTMFIFQLWELAKNSNALKLRFNLFPGGVKTLYQVTTEIYFS